MASGVEGVESQLQVTVQQIPLCERRADLGQHGGVVAHGVA